MSNRFFDDHPVLEPDDDDDDEPECRPVRTKEESEEYDQMCSRAQFAEDARMLRDCLIERIEGTRCEEAIEMITSTVVSTNEDGTVGIVLGIQNDTNHPARHIRVSITRGDD